MNAIKKQICIILIISLLCGLFAGSGVTVSADDLNTSSDIIPGDINGDGSVNVDDVTTLMQYSILPQLYPISYPGNVDFNHDDSVDVDDVLRLMQYSILPNIYTLETEPEESGSFGEGLTWAFDESTGQLTITGDGTMPEAFETNKDVPWYAFRNKITEVVVEEGVGSIAGNGLSLCKNLTEVTILNPDCVIPDAANALGSTETTIIYGYTDSTADLYAQTWGYTFDTLTPATTYYTVTFDSQGGSEVASQQVEEGGFAEYPEAPTLENHLFVAWYWDSECTQYFNFEVPITEDITLYAGWRTEELTYYTVTFDSQGGSEVPSQQVAAGSCAEYPATPTLKDNLFITWFLDSECTEFFDFETPIVEDMTLYAGWTDQVLEGSDSGAAYYSISSLSIDPDSQTAETTVSAPGDCRLLIRFIDEDIYFSNEYPENKEYLAEATLYSSQNIAAGTDSERFTTNIMGHLPETFVAEAILLDSEGNALIDPFSDIEHTERYVRFMEKTIYDFEGETVLNFDESEDNNFGVLNPEVRILTAETGVQDEVTGNYILTGLSEEVLPGDKVLIQLSDDSFLFRVKTVTEHDGVIEIFPVLEGDSEYGYSLTDFYIFLKIDMFQGIATEDSDETGGHESTASNPLVLDLSPFSKTISVNPSVSLLDVTGSTTVSIQRLLIQLDLEGFGLKYCRIECTKTTDTSASISISWGESYANHSYEYEHNGKEPSETINKNLRLAYIPIPTQVPGLTLFIEVGFQVQVEFNAGAVFTITSTSEVFTRFTTTDGIQKDTKKESTSTMQISGSVEARAGFFFTFGIKALEILSVEISLFIGIKASIERDLINYSPLSQDSYHHGCYACYKGGLYFVFEPSITAACSLSDLWKDSSEGGGANNNNNDNNDDDNNIIEKLTHLSRTWSMPFEVLLFECHLSLLNPPDSLYGGKLNFGTGPCENLAYRTTINVYDSSDRIIANRVTIKTSKSNQTEKTYVVSGGNSTYLYPGFYTGTVKIEGEEFTKNFTVTDEPLTVDFYAGYFIRFDRNGGDSYGSGMPDQFVRSSEKTFTLNKLNYHKTNYKFIGWSLSREFADGDNLIADEAVIDYCLGEIGETVVLYAQWAPRDYIIQLYANNETELKYEYSREYHSRFKLNNPFTYRGNEFVGWTTSSTGSGDFYNEGQEITVTDTLILFAQWNRVTYTIEFMGNGADSYSHMSNQIADYIVDENDKVGVPLNANQYYKSNYKFKGWSTEPEGDVIFEDGDLVRNLAKPGETVKLYAQWELDNFTIQLYANNGTALKYEYTRAYQSPFKLSNPFTYAGYDFSGWTTSSNGTGDFYYEGEEITVEETLVLHAQWVRATYTIMFMGNGADSYSNTPSQIADRNANVQLNTNDFYRSGYTFTGWNTAADGSGTSYPNNATVSNLAKNGGTIKLYAQWQCRHLNMAYTYDDNGHFAQCKTCGYVASKESHKVQKYKQDDSNGHYWTCDCGYKSKTIPHTYDAYLGYLSSPDGSTHYQHCSTCGYNLYEDHSYTYKSDDSAGHHLECTVCHHKKGEVVYHTYPNAWTNSTTTYHRKTCTATGCDYYIQAAHSYSSWKYYNNNNHRKTCVCGRYKEAAHSAPATWNKGDTTYHTGICPDCSAQYKQKHTWTTTGNPNVQQCTKCKRTKST